VAEIESAKNDFASATASGSSYRSDLSDAPTKYEAAAEFVI
jgi:hypothetical protein